MCTVTQLIWFWISLPLESIYFLWSGAQKVNRKAVQPFIFATYSFYSWLVSYLYSCLIRNSVPANFYNERVSTEWEFEEFSNKICFEVENLYQCALCHKTDKNLFLQDSDP